VSVEYWNKEKNEWLPSHATTEDEIDRLNATVEWEMYRKAE